MRSASRRTAGGNDGADAVIGGIAVGAMSGVAPRARIASYKVCWTYDEPAEATGRILAVDDDQVELPVGDQPRQAFAHNSAARAANDVADEENAHALVFSLADDHIRKPVPTFRDHALA